MRSPLVTSLLAGSAFILAACGGADDTSPETTTTPPPPAPSETSRADDAPPPATGAQDGAHVHGLGNLSLVMTENRLDAVMIAPAANFVSPEGESMDDQALSSLLENGSALYQLPEEAGCTQTGHTIAELKVHHDDDDHDDHADDHDHEGHDHDDDSHGEDDHNHDHDEADGKMTTEHKDFEVVHTFECTAPGRMNQVRVRYFNRFGGFETIKASLTTDIGEAYADLTPDSQRIRGK